ncbi:MAG: hypothetical protein EOM05_03955 [Clostridia bacterium]|nr:hypothetical protein [Clostridia bacterium]
MDSKLDALLKTEDDSDISVDNSNKFSNTKREINSICRALCIETQKYDPQKTVANIDKYLQSNNKIDRVLYSEISNYIFSLDTSSRGIFATNVEKMLLYSLYNNNQVNDDCRKIIIKIYDHFQLALHQIENANNIFAESIGEAKINLQKEIKGVEKEYISILGIFAAIVLAFVGGITFSSSVLQNIGGVSIYRLLIVVDFLAFTLINVIYILMKFIFVINNKDSSIFKIKAINITCLIIGISILLSWGLNLDLIQEFLKEILPWGK